MGDGRPKERQDGITHQTGQGAFVPVYRLDQLCECTIYDLSPLFRVQLFGGGGGAGNIAEKHGHHPALPELASAGPDRFQFLKQFLGNVPF